MSPPQSSQGQLRPPLHRANTSSQSAVSIVDSACSDGSSSASSSVSSTSNSGKRRPSMSTARMAALNAASARSSPMASPMMLRTPSGGQPQMRSYFDGAVMPAAIDMTRNESNESQRSLKTKTSRKELKEMARSATPSKGRQNHSDNYHNDDDDDARSVDSFTCSHSNEFDRQHRAHSSSTPTIAASSVSSGRPDIKAQQRWLDATFRKLSQKSGQRRAGNDRSRQAGDGLSSGRFNSADGNAISEAAELAAKTKAHFLDFSAIISPVPTKGDVNAVPYEGCGSSTGRLAVPSLSSSGSGSANVTPRPSDCSRFALPLPSPVPSDMTMQQRQQQHHPALRTRRSEDSLTVRRRMQRHHASSSSQQTVALVSPPAGELSLAGSHPVPQLPDWARTFNRQTAGTPSQGSFSTAPGLPADMCRAVSHDVVGSYDWRPVDMDRATSQDAGSALQLSLGPSLMSNFDDWNVGASDMPPLSPSHIHIPRSQSSMGHHQSRAARPSVAPLTFQQPHRRHQQQQPSIDSTSPAKSAGYNLNRGSVSSATSDSDVGSSISSVPQTPVSRSHILSSSINGLGSGLPPIDFDGRAGSVYYDSADSPMPTLDSISHPAVITGNGDEDQLSTLRKRWLEEKALSTATAKEAPPPPPSAYFMTPRSAAMRPGQHVARMFSEESSAPMAPIRPNHAPTASLSCSAGHETSDALRAPVRARSSTTTEAMGSSGAAAAVLLTSKATPISPSRVSSLHHARHGSGSSSQRRTSVASNNSIMTSASSASSSSTTSSGASALLSYMRSSHSKSSGNLSGSTEKPLPSQPQQQSRSGLRKQSSSSSSHSSRGAPSSSGTLHGPSSPGSASRRTGGILPEELASSIGRKFGRSLASVGRG